MVTTNTDPGRQTVQNGCKSRRVLKPGLNVPLIAIFKSGSEDVDVGATAQHAIRMAKAGLTSLTVHGSNGEAVHLSRDERNLVTATVRAALDGASFSHIPVVVGCSAQSVRGTISACEDARDAGGDYALVLPPSYYRSAYSEDVLIEYFRAVADRSPIPVLIYNYPNVVSGIDLSSTHLTTLAQHPNIVGCKLTCGNTGKLNRVANALTSKNSKQVESNWMCFGGNADFILQSLIAGGDGTVAGLANIIPKACVKVYDLYLAGEVAKAQRLQAIVARADLVVIEGGVVGTKSGMQSWYEYGGVARRPLPEPTPELTRRYKEMLREAVEIENQL